MSLYLDQKVIQKDRIPKMSIAILAIIAIFSIYVVGYDQGQLFSLVQGTEAFDTMWLHEFTHDIRHASGFPCH
ncbi:MAG: CbtB-domain containing protein [Thermoproteota archaeon]|nr:CbtB-domain containing protein [Nitrosopumilus sp.]MDQ3083767.1 CbtB-domain containing protein [Thermoproteota archaeon]